MLRKAQPSRPEIWGGIECTINRVDERYFDQCEMLGNALCEEHIDLFSKIGITGFRFPLLWEKSHSCVNHWEWGKGCLEKLVSLNIRPIVGLVHHGSGPEETSLLDSSFASKLAIYAEEVAKKFPFIKDYTPINEPLTTARFSALYGFWYPHAKDDLSFLRALINECKATVLSMQAIRKHVPDARLIQTEDLGKVLSTPTLQYQSDFENERRWLSLDLLCGRVNKTHPLHDFIVKAGISDDELKWFEDNHCLPNVLGFNYYVTSERFLDERLELYPPRTHGGNGRLRYADVEAVRIGQQIGVGKLLREASKRYALPLALTEVHLGCTREEQLRWANEIWQQTLSAVEQGIDVRAVTCWAMLGSFDWDTLVTRRSGYYESGLFDIRGETPRMTALGKFWSAIAKEEDFDHPTVSAPGWWERPDCLYHDKNVDISRQRRIESSSHSKPLVITGGRGTLGRAFARVCHTRGISTRVLTRDELDICEIDAVRLLLQSINPWAVINAAGYVRVDDAEQDSARCIRENVCGPETLAKVCAELNIPFVTFSSDLVFDGSRNTPYVESDCVSPINVYGKSKAEAERLVLACGENSLVIRTSAFFGPWDEHNFVVQCLRSLAAGNTWTAAADLVVSPTYVPDLVNGTLDLLIDRESGLWHLANEGSISWAELARLSADMAGYPQDKIISVPAAALALAAPRPPFSALKSERGQVIGSFEKSLRQMIKNDHFQLCANG